MMPYKKSLYPVRHFIILLITSIFFFFSFIYANAQNYLSDSAEVIGTITGMSTGGRYSPASTTIVYTVNNSSYTKTIYSYPINAYSVGQKLMVKYAVDNPSNGKPLFYKPYFEPGELPDTTEGIVLNYYEGSGLNSCYIYYKIYDPIDSTDVMVLAKERYISNDLSKSIQIKNGVVYKVIYNKNFISAVNAEILFSEIVDSSHKDLNSHLYTALLQATNVNPTDAINNYNYCIHIEPNNSFYFFQRAKCYDAIHENEKALSDYSTYINFNPNKMNGYIRKSIIYIRLNKFKQATQELNMVLFKDNSNDEANYLMGVIN